MANTFLIKDARIIDPARGLDEVGDILIKDGQILSAGERVSPHDVPQGCQVIPASGLVACPGFIDLHCHLREPGFEYKETIATGTRAALSGSCPLAVSARNARARNWPRWRNWRRREWWPSATTATQYTTPT